MSITSLDHIIIHPQDESFKKRWSILLPHIYRGQGGRTVCVDSVAES